LSAANSALSESNAQVSALAGSNGSAAMSSGDAAALVAANAHADAGDASTLAAANADADPGNPATRQNATAHTDSKVQAMSADISDRTGEVDVLEANGSKLGGRLDRGGALSAAMSQMSSAGAANSNGSRVSAGFGNYHGKSAFAVGFQSNLST